MILITFIPPLDEPAHPPINENIKHVLPESIDILFVDIIEAADVKQCKKPMLSLKDKRATIANNPKYTFICILLNDNAFFHLIISYNGNPLTSISRDTMYSNLFVSNNSVYGTPVVVRTELAMKNDSKMSLLQATAMANVPQAITHNNAAIYSKIECLYFGIYRIESLLSNFPCAYTIFITEYDDII